MRYAVFFPAILLSGCAGVSFNQLNPDLSAKSAPEGAVYYLPKPVLIVSVAPVAAADAGEPGHLPPPVAAPAPAPAPAKGKKKKVVAPPPVPGPGGGLAGGAAATDDKSDSKDTSKDSAAAPATPASDQSFSISVPGYTLKLVYLPDYTRPMRLSVHAGLGTASLKPTLQNGWMLTGFDAQADSKAAELLASVAQMVTAAKGPAAQAASAATKGGGLGAAPAPDTGILKPGMYDIRYDKTSGNLKGLCPLTYFTADGPVAPTTVPANCQ